jgi:hypothetical protein
MDAEELDDGSGGMRVRQEERDFTKRRMIRRKRSAKERRRGVHAATASSTKTAL